MELEPLRARAPANVRFVPRFVTDEEVAALFRRADLAVLPYRQVDQSGVLFTALAFGTPLVASDVGGFAEVAATGAAELVPPADAGGAARRAGRPARRPRPPGRMAAAAREAAATTYAWDAIARRTLDLYARLGAPLATMRRREARRQARILGLGRAAGVHAGWATPPCSRASTACAGRASRLLPDTDGDVPDVSLVVAAYNEAAVIAAKVANALRARLPARPARGDRRLRRRDRRARPQRARAAGADRRDREAARRQGPRAGRGGGARPRRGRGLLGRQRDLGARRAARARRPFPDPRVGYVCGQVRFAAPRGPTRRACTGATRCGCAGWSPRRASVTGGNGAIYATRREDYVEVDPVMGHDLSFPFTFVKRGRRAVYAPAARATEKMVPTDRGRVRAQAADDVPRLADRRARRPARPARLRRRCYGLMVASHRVLRYPAPFLHLLALGRERRRCSARRRHVRRLGRAAALLRRARRAARPAALVARYYVLTQASIAAGLADWLRHGTEAGWTPPEGTR